MVQQDLGTELNLHAVVALCHIKSRVTCNCCPHRGILLLVHLVDERGHDGGLVDADVPRLEVFHLAADVHGPRPILDARLLQRQSGYLRYN